jgi:hypothetical protein
MTGFWRLWVTLMTLAAAVFTGFGLRPGMAGGWWPIAGLWCAAVWASYGLSVWSAGCLIVLGVMMDYIAEGPIGAWAFALLCAYGVGLVVWDRAPPLSGIVAEVIAVVGGLIACALALAIGGAVSGQAGFASGDLTWNLIITAVLYPGARFALIVADAKEQRR